ncbi:MAG: hypothetical protein ACYC2X_03675 [Coriobacteriia bacterium]
MSRLESRRVWTARVAVGAVFLMNVQCALSFIAWPERFTGGFGLAGVPGQIALRGLGIAFLMWNATYPLVMWDPQRHRTVFGIVLAQSLIGLVGESWLLLSLPAGHPEIAASLARFIVFDGAGLLLMAAAFVLSRRQGRGSGERVP